MTTPQQEIGRYLMEARQRMERALLRTMQYCGEAVLRVARSTNSYKDQTGNLRSSTGYVIAIDGRIAAQSSFQTVKQGGEGAATGAEYARKLVSQYPKGVVLIVVAGMEYAAYVANRGYDVLDSAELEAERIVPRMLKTLKL